MLAAVYTSSNSLNASVWNMLMSGCDRRTWAKLGLNEHILPALCPPFASTRDRPLVLGVAVGHMHIASRHPVRRHIAG
jgi:hypothetical protein